MNTELDKIEGVLDHIGIYPAAVHGGDHPYNERDDYKNGWNAAVMEISGKIANAVDTLREEGIDKHEKVLIDAGILDFDGDEYYINFNDVWAWALSDGETLRKEEIEQVYDLFWRYGWCGVLYWASKRNEDMLSEFHDNNRFIEFVRQEEELKKKVPDSDKRAYTKLKYTVGVE